MPPGTRSRRCGRGRKYSGLDTVLEQAPPAVKDRFAALTGGPAHTGSDPGRADAGTGDDSAADAEHRLIADENISLALSRLDQLAGGEPGTARRKVAALLSGLDRRHVLDRAGRRARIGRRRIAQALGGYYHGQAGRHGRYGAHCGQYGEIVTSVLTHPDWLDFDCALTGAGDRLTLAGATAEGGTLLDQQAAEAAAWRLAETLSAGTRLVDMPLYRLAGIDVGKGRIGGSLAIAQFASYALRLDLVIGSMFGGAVLAAAVPEAFSTRGPVFAGTYVAVQAGRSLFLVIVTRGGEHRPEARELFWSGVSALPWLAGAAAQGWLGTCSAVGAGSGHGLHGAQARLARSGAGPRARGGVRDLS